MNYKELKSLEEKAVSGQYFKPGIVLKLISEIRSLQKANNTWRYSDGMRHPLDMD